MVDLARLQRETISSSGSEEAVTVNTRALVDKILARYAGEWTTLRELIQNASDATATKVVIRFETLPSTEHPIPQQADSPTLLNHVVSHHTLHRLVVSNDGTHFDAADWARLKRIAEGNPDEKKIGAFGVGFYSVFADCESPFVVSGKKTMAFLWKENSLYTKASNIADPQQTSFLLNYRHAAPIPDLMSICQFLCTSLTFVGLQHIELWLDQWNILRLEKKFSPSLPASLPSDIVPTTKDGLMKIAGVSHQSNQIDAHWLNIICKPSTTVAAAKVEETPTLAIKSFFTRFAAHATTSSAARQAQREKELAEAREIHDNLDKASHGSVFLRTTTATIACAVSKAFAAELERATKKPPPKTTTVAVLTASRDDIAAGTSATSGVTGSKAEELFSSVLPSKSGRVFIGFPTAQTTGLLCHISAPSVIPTVERESIDLNARHVKTWNTELLRVAGIVCRMAYVGSMDDLGKTLRAAFTAGGREHPSEHDIANVIPEAAHIFKQFRACESTPLPAVGALIEEAFWSCSRKSQIDILSTKGVLPSNKVRVVPEQLRFLENVPAIPPALLKAGEDFLHKLYEKNLIFDVTVLDVRRELENQALSLPNMIMFLQWLTKQAATTFDMSTTKSLLGAAVGTYDEGDRGKMIALSQIETFIPGNKIPASMPLPSTTLPFVMSRHLTPTELSALGWEELQILPWVRYLLEAPARAALTEDEDLTKSADFAKAVHHVLSKHWDSINNASKETVRELFTAKRVMPTKLGMRIPSEAYFASVKLFNDLPTITLDHTVKEKYLVALGVRKTIEISIVFERLMNSKSGAKWSFTDLVRYLVAVNKDIPPKDIERLRTQPICPQLDPETGGQRSTLVPIHALYEPLPALQSLGLPTLYWPDRFSPGGNEAKFLKFLGLKSQPQYKELVAMMVKAGAEANQASYDAALQYLVQNYEKNNYGGVSKDGIQDLAFLPTEGKPFPQLATPKSCYSNESAAVLGYPILQANMQPHAAKLGVKKDPTMKECAECLVGNPPASQEDATQVFGYFASRLKDISNETRRVLGSANIVPVTKHGRIRLTPPKMCFLGDASTYGEILDFVNFGELANLFLQHVGSKTEPSAAELAQIVKDSPANVLNVIGKQRYADLLRRLADQAGALRKDQVLWKALRDAPFLLARRATPKARPAKPSRDSKKFDDRPLLDRPEEKPLLDDLDDDENDDFVDELFLRKASQVVVIDSDREFFMFRTHLYAAPPDEQLEKFYIQLGSPNLTALLILDERIGSPKRDQSGALSLKQLLVERSRLFLHEHSERRHDAKWLDSNLTVTTVDSLSMTTSLKGLSVRPHHERKTAVLPQKGRSHTLFITNKPDLFEVSRCVIALLLNKHRHNDVLALEMVLLSDLRALRAKGYNVERILQRQARETRLADEERQHQQAEEERQAAERRRLAQSNSQNGAVVAPPAYDAGASSGYDDHDPMQPPMPGAFEPHEPHQNALRNRGRDLFTQLSQWGRQLGGTGRDHDGTPQLPQYPDPADLAPQPTQHVAEPLPPSVGSGGDAAGSDRRTRSNLASAVASCRPHNSASVYNPPSASAVDAAAASSYCDAAPAHDLAEAGALAGGVRLFLPRALTQGAARAQVGAVVQDNAVGLAAFARLLVQLASVFGMDAARVVHVFVDPRGSSIAFNASGALFFNCHYFMTLHLPRIAAAGADGERQRAAHVDAVAYWWITMCHELAHNLVREHSAAHSFYAESFATQYFVGAMRIVTNYQAMAMIGVPYKN